MLGLGLDAQVALLQRVRKCALTGGCEGPHLSNVHGIPLEAVHTPETTLKSHIPKSIGPPPKPPKECKSRNEYLFQSVLVQRSLIACGAFPVVSEKKAILACGPFDAVLE